MPERQKNTRESIDLFTQSTKPKHRVLMSLQLTSLLSVLGPCELPNPSKDLESSVTYAVHTKPHDYLN